MDNLFPEFFVIILESMLHLKYLSNNKSPFDHIKVEQDEFGRRKRSEKKMNTIKLDFYDVGTMNDGGGSTDGRESLVFEFLDLKLDI